MGKIWKVRTEERTLEAVPLGKKISSQIRPSLGVFKGAVGRGKKTRPREK